MKYLMICGLVAIGVCGCDRFNDTEEGFTQEDVDQTKQLIKDEYNHRDGVTVLEVTMMKESPTKLMGYVKLSTKFMPNGITKSCGATMGQNRRYIWKCE